MSHNAEFYIKQLNLEEHPEGGYFRETYRSDGIFASTGPGRDTSFPENRNYATAIYFLLKGHQFSRFHRIRSDEIWHFYAGTSATIQIIHPDSLYEAKVLGPNVDQGQAFQVVVPAKSWFGVSVDNPSGFLLAGCTVSPGFDFRDFEMPEAYQLKQAFPEHADIIDRLS